MNTVKNLLILTSVFLLSIACTEEISNELKNAENASVGETIAEKAVGNKFKLVHKMDENLSFKMHRSENRNWDCELEASGSNFSAANYAKDDKKDAIDCVLEVEELDLFHEGVEFEIQVDQFLCEYVEFTPFKFYSWPVGSSRQTQYNLTCDSLCAEVNASLCDSIEGNYLTFRNGSSEITGLGVEFSNKQDAVCKFDYSESGGPNCDSGYTSTIKYKLKGIPGTCSSPYEVYTTEETCTGAGGAWTQPICTEFAGGNTIETDSNDDEITDCGGSTYNCMDGPAKDLLPDIRYTSEIYENRDLSFFSKSWKVPAPISNNSNLSNRYVANFSRICANNDSKTSFSTTPLYESNSTTAGLLGFEVEQMRPAVNSSEPYVAEVVDYNNDGYNDYTVYADHPFLGRSELFSTARFVAQPYYGFKCLDKARDVKAQIRLFIREWDRQFDQDSTVMEFLSDVDATSPLMDNDLYQNDDDPWNDISDWDDFLKDIFKNNDTCGALHYAVNPGECYEEITPNNADCSNNTDITQEDCEANNGTWYSKAYYCEAASPAGAGGVWVEATSKCYDNSTSTVYTSKASCEGTPGSKKWFYNQSLNTNSWDFTNNFPYWSI